MSTVLLNSYINSFHTVGQPTWEDVEEMNREEDEEKMNRDRNRYPFFVWNYIVLCVRMLV